MTAWKQRGNRMRLMGWMILGMPRGSEEAHDTFRVQVTSSRSVREAPARHGQNPDREVLCAEV